jgi:hypothetical protein
MNSHFL